MAITSSAGSRSAGAGSEAADVLPGGLPIDAADWSDDDTGPGNEGVAVPRRSLAGMDGLLLFARERLTSMVEDARDSLVSQVRGLKGLADLVTDNLPQGAAPVAAVVGDAANSIDAIADALASKSVDELVDDGRALVRAQPAVAIGVAIAVGFLAGRFLKAAQD